MKLGIVGSEQAKFTVNKEAYAHFAIYNLIEEFRPTAIVSGHCHLGGVDIYAEECARRTGTKLEIYPPKTKHWSTGYKPRNLLIAKQSDIVVCITLEHYKKSYTGLRFKGCYHCGNRNPPHVKSGGCWTAWRAIERRWIIL